MGQRSTFRCGSTCINMAYTWDHHSPSFPQASCELLFFEKKISNLIYTVYTHIRNVYTYKKAEILMDSIKEKLFLQNHYKIFFYLWVLGTIPIWFDDVLLVLQNPTNRIHQITVDIIIVSNKSNTISIIAIIVLSRVSAWMTQTELECSDWNFEKLGNVLTELPIYCA